jgi:hypothetical protein
MLRNNPSLRIIHDKDAIEGQHHPKGMQIDNQNMVLEGSGFYLMTLPSADDQQDNVEMHVHLLGEQVGMEEAKKEARENLEIKMELLRSFDKEKGHMEHWVACIHHPKNQVI